MIILRTKTPFVFNSPLCFISWSFEINESIQSLTIAFRGVNFSHEVYVCCFIYIYIYIYITFFHRGIHFI